jgi:MerR-like DNA binding protein
MPDTRVAGLTIREVAEKTGITAHTLRYHERIGLMAPVTRAHRGHRRYDADELRWVELLKRLHESGMPIAALVTNVVDMKVRRFASRQRPKRRGGRSWITWSTEEIYESWACSTTTGWPGAASPGAGPHNLVLTRWATPDGGNLRVRWLAEAMSSSSSTAPTCAVPPSLCGRRSWPRRCASPRCGYDDVRPVPGCPQETCTIGP